MRTFDHEYRSLIRRVMSETYRKLHGRKGLHQHSQCGPEAYIPCTPLSLKTCSIGYYMRGESGTKDPAPECRRLVSWRSAANPVLRDVHDIPVFCKGRFPKGAEKEQHNRTRRISSLTKSVWSFLRYRQRASGIPPVSYRASSSVDTALYI